MKKSVYRIAALLLAVLFLFSGCSSDGTITQPSYDEEAPLTQVPSQQVAANSAYTLEWDADVCAVFLKEIATGTVWGTVPYDYYLTGETDSDLNAPIVIDYVDTTQLMSDFLNGFTDSVKKGRTSSRLIENGVEVTYYFDKVSISVPVQYCLRDDSLAISVNFPAVCEGPTYKLLSVSVAPFLCSVANDTAGSYLVIPSGTGALMYSDVRAEGTRTFANDIFGTDAAKLVPEKLVPEEAIRMPVFGVSNGNKGLLAIVEDGAEAAAIEAEAGAKRSGYTNAYTTFYARGYDIFETKVSWLYRDAVRIYGTIKQSPSTVGFYPLSEAEADYVGMAKRYREYLIETEQLQKASNESTYGLYMTGGLLTDALFLGIPYQTPLTLTTFNQAKTMVEELTAATSVAPVVQLIGFGASGLTPGKVAGGLTFASDFGSKGDRLALEETCKTLNVPLYTDFNLVQFRSNGLGYSSLMDATKSAALHKVELFYNDKALQDFDVDEISYLLLKRDHLGDMVNRLKTFATKNKISGISLATLTELAYSDYSDPQYAIRGGMTTDVQNYIAQLQSAGLPVAATGGNTYAAVKADCVLNVSMTDGEYRSLDTTIPFYQMVFKGYKSMYSTAVNATGDMQKSVALAVQGGTSLGFSLVGEYDMDAAKSPYSGLNASDYAGNKQAIIDTVKACNAYYNAIRGAAISGYDILENGLTLTTFDNGVRVYVNMSNSSAESPLGTLDAYGFAFEVGGAE